MYRYGIPLSFLLMVVFGVQSLFFWGGLAATRGDVGKVVWDDAKAYDRIAFSYVWMGKQIVQTSAPLFGPAYAEEHAGAVYPTVMHDPQHFLDRVKAGMGPAMTLAYWGTPLCFVALVLLWFFRPKTIRSLGR